MYILACLKVQPFLKERKHVSWENGPKFLQTLASTGLMKRKYLGMSQSFNWGCKKSIFVMQHIYINV